MSSGKKSLAAPLMWIRTIFFILTRVPFLLILIALGCFGFVLNDQGMDLMVAFGMVRLCHPKQSVTL